MGKSELGSPGQQGFTLIEIIAVLVILGILAVVAVPKYFNLQNDARQQAIKGLIASAQSQLSMGYANQQMNSAYGFSVANIPAECLKVAVSGNASITCEVDGNNAIITGTVDGVSNTGNWNNPEG